MFDFNNKTIMVTGCCGTVGSEIIKEIYEDEKYINTRIIGIDNNESGLFNKKFCAFFIRVLSFYYN